MKRINIIFALAALFAVFTSCDSLLDQQPPLQMDNDKVLSTYTGLEQATNAAYSPLYSANWYGRGFVVISDLKGGNGKSSPLNTGRFQTEYNWANTSSNTSGLWATAYGVIARANNVINAIDDLDESGVTQAQKDQLKGECMFLRALGHFDLVRMYAQSYAYAKTQTGVRALGVPYITKTEIAEPARDDVTTVYANIVTDLLAAELIIGDATRESTDAKAFANKEAVQALLAKVYLYMEEWQNAADYATTVINSGAFTMYTQASFSDAWGVDASSEVIFEIHGNNTESNWPGFDEIGYIFHPDGYGDVCASQQLIDLYEAGDVRSKLFMGWDANPGFSWPTKYPGKGDQRVNNIPVLRLSEMYLIRAEAALNGSTGNAASDLDEVRSNRGATTLAATLQNVYNERRRELCFEGNALFDLARTQKGLVRVDEDGNISGDVNIDFPNYRWAMPIPIAELEANTNMVQNETY